MSREKIWQLTELNGYLKGNAEDKQIDSKTVFLCNPTEKAELHRIICQHLWPALINALANVSVRVLGANDGFPEYKIRDEKHENTTCYLTFVFEDSEKPLSATRCCTPWYYRGCLQCSILHYMISSEFYLELPSTIGFRKTHKLLSNPMFAGNPPTLSIASISNSEEIWTVAFSEGYSEGWNIKNPHDAVQRIYKKMEQTLAIIRAVNVLSNDYQSTTAFKALQTALCEAYISL